MGTIIDIVALLIVIVAAGFAYYKGFVKTFFGFVSTILAVILACVFCGTLATYIKENTGVDEFIINSIISINGQESGDLQEADTNVVKESGDSLTNIIDSLPNTLNNMIGLDKIKEEATTNLVNKIADIAINIMSWIIIYAVVRIVLAIVTLVCDGIMSLPLLKTVNNLAGLALGAIMGLFRIYFILAVVYFISNIVNVSGIVNAIGMSTFVSQMYNNNLLIKLIF